LSLTILFPKIRKFVENFESMQLEIYNYCDVFGYTFRIYFTFKLIYNFATLKKMRLNYYFVDFYGFKHLDFVKI